MFYKQIFLYLICNGKTEANVEPGLGMKKKGGGDKAGIHFAYAGLTDNLYFRGKLYIHYYIYDTTNRICVKTSCTRLSFDNRRGGAHLPNLPRVGLVNLFIQHTSAALSVNENCDPDVRGDMEKIFNNLVKERESWYDHTLEGWDDMPAHAKSTIVGASLTIPITDGRFNLGTWQGIYLCEFRNHGGGRHIVATVIGE